MRFFKNLFKKKSWQDRLTEPDWETTEIFTNENEFFDFLFPQNFYFISEYNQMECVALYNALTDEMIFLKANSHYPQERKTIEGAQNKFISKLKEGLGFNFSEDTNDPNIKMWAHFNSNLLKSKYGENSGYLKYTEKIFNKLYALANTHQKYQQARCEHNNIPLEYYVRTDGPLLTGIIGKSAQPARSKTTASAMVPSLSEIIAGQKKEVGDPIAPPISNPPTPTTSITSPTSPSDIKITKALILETLWGKGNNEQPDKDSACGKTIELWKDTKISIKFSKPTEDHIKVDDSGKNINIKLSYQLDENKSDSLTLNRTVDETTQTQTWTCTAQFDNYNLTDEQKEKKRFELIAAESFALRRAQKISNADSIAILDIQDNDEKKSSAKENFRCETNLTLTKREQTLLQANLDSGFTSIYYKSSWVSRKTEHRHEQSASLPSEYFLLNPQHHEMEKPSNPDEKPSAEATKDSYPP